MPPNAALATERLTRRFSAGRGTAVEVGPLTLSVEEGETTALLGRNGAGKTTVLRMLATVVRPSFGSARVLGHDVAGEPGVVRRLVGVSLGSDRSFYWRLTALQNLLFFARLKGLPGRRAPDGIARVAAELDIERFLPRPVRALSRGVLAKLSLCRAMMGDPPLLLLDEPFASVDVRGRELVWAALARRAGRGHSALVATNDAALAARCDSRAPIAGRRYRV
jgi:ABC-2 type transport system ATP-binding protein